MRDLEIVGTVLGWIGFLSLLGDFFAVLFVYPLGWVAPVVICFLSAALAVTGWTISAQCEAWKNKDAWQR